MIVIGYLQNSQRPEPYNKFGDIVPVTAKPFLDADYNPRHVPAQRVIVDICWDAVYIVVPYEYVIGKE